VHLVGFYYKDNWLNFIRKTNCALCGVGIESLNMQNTGQLQIKYKTLKGCISEMDCYIATNLAQL